MYTTARFVEESEAIRKKRNKTMKKVQAAYKEQCISTPAKFSESISDLNFDRLEKELEKLKQLVHAVLEQNNHTCTQEGTVEMMTPDYVNLKKDLLKEKKRNEKLRMTIRNLKRQNKELICELQNSLSKSETKIHRPSKQKATDRKRRKSADVTPSHESEVIQDSEAEVEEKTMYIENSDIDDYGKMMKTFSLSDEPDAGNIEIQSHERSDNQPSPTVIAVKPCDSPSQASVKSNADAHQPSPVESFSMLVRYSTSASDYANNTDTKPGSDAFPEWFNQLTIRTQGNGLNQRSTGDFDLLQTPTKKATKSRRKDIDLFQQNLDWFQNPAKKPSTTGALARRSNSVFVSSERNPPSSTCIKNAEQFSRHSYSLVSSVKPPEDDKFGHSSYRRYY